MPKRMDATTLKELAQEAALWQLPGPWGKITWHLGEDGKPRVSEWAGGCLSLQLVCLRPRKKAMYKGEIPYHNVCFTDHELLEDGEKPEHFTRRLRGAAVAFVIRLRQNRAPTAPIAGGEPTEVERRGCCGG